MELINKFLVSVTENVAQNEMIVLFVTSKNSFIVTVKGCESLLTLWTEFIMIFMYTEVTKCKANTCTVLAKRVQYFAFNDSLTSAMNRHFVLLNNSYKNWSIIKSKDSFGICTS